MRLGRPKEYHSRSNTPTKETNIKNEEREGFEWDIFETSPTMSLYLLTWAVSKYKYSTARTETTGIEVRAYFSDPSVTQHSANVAATILEHFEQKIFKIDYELTKLDMIAVPLYYFGAMEHWGMNTYAMTQGGAFSEEDKDARTMMSFDQTISHELVGSFISHYEY